jgi:hypothetical protein
MNGGMQQRSLSLPIPMSRMDRVDQDEMSMWDHPRDMRGNGMGNSVVVFQPNMQNNVPMLQSSGNRVVPLTSNANNQLPQFNPMRGSDYRDVEDNIELADKKVKKVPAGSVHRKNKSSKVRSSRRRNATQTATGSSPSKEETFLFRFVKNGKKAKKRGKKSKGKLYLAKLKKM